MYVDIVIYKLAMIENHVKCSIYYLQISYSALLFVYLAIQRVKQIWFSVHRFVLILDLRFLTEFISYQYDVISTFNKRPSK